MILQLCSLIQIAAMFQDKYVFSQLTVFLNRTLFNNYVRKYDGNRYVKHFTCWNQMLAMMFGQLSNRESLREADDQHPLSAYKSVWLLSHTVLLLLSNMIWIWNAQPMKSCRFSAYHWLTKPTCMTCSTRLISMMSKI